MIVIGVFLCDRAELWRCWIIQMTVICMELAYYEQLCISLTYTIQFLDSTINYIMISITKYESTKETPYLAFHIDWVIPLCIV